MYPNIAVGYTLCLLKHVNIAEITVKIINFSMALWLDVPTYSDQRDFQ